MANARIIRRTISQPADGSDFSVALSPPEVTDDYALCATVTKGDTVVAFELIEEVAGDRTTTAFRVLTSDALPTGAVVEFILVRAS